MDLAIRAPTSDEMSFLDVIFLRLLVFCDSKHATRPEGERRDDPGSGASSRLCSQVCPTIAQRLGTLRAPLSRVRYPQPSTTPSSFWVSRRAARSCSTAPRKKAAESTVVTLQGRGAKAERAALAWLARCTEASKLQLSRKG